MTPRAAREGFIEEETPFDRPTEPQYEKDKPVRSAGNGRREPELEQTPPPPATGEDEWPMVIKLRKPLLIENRQTTTELHLREPTTDDIMNAGGNPCRIEIVQMTGNQAAFSPIIDDGKMLRLIANISNVMEPFLKKLDPRDYNTIAYQLRRFFLPEGKLW